MLGSLLGGRIGVLFAKPQIDRRLVIACLYQVLLREGSFLAAGAAHAERIPAGNALRDDASKYSVKQKNTLDVLLLKGACFVLRRFGLGGAMHALKDRGQLSRSTMR